MQVQQVLITPSTLQDASLWSPLYAFSPDLLLVFANRTILQDPAFLDYINRFSRHTTIIGGSSVGEIYKEGCTENHGILTAIKFERSQITSHAISLENQDSFEAGKQLGLAFQAQPPSHLFLLAPDHLTNGEAFVFGVQTALPNTTLMGGLVGDVVAPRIGLTLFNNQISQTNAVAVGFSGDLKVLYGAAGGWSRFGPARKVTSADARYLYTLNGEGALSLYKRYLGTYAAELPFSGLFFPLSLLNDQHEEVGIIRSVSDVDEEKDAIIMAGTVAGYSHVQMMCASTDALVTAIEHTCHQMAEEMPNTSSDCLGLMISCIGRKIVMGGRTEEEVEAMTNAFGQSHYYCGMHAFGEISPMRLDAKTADHSLFYNQTATIAFLHE